MPPVRSTDLVDHLVDGRYRIVSHLADGGMASVYVAVDERLERQVALKVLRADLVADPAFVSRFRREARAAARLSNPHVVGVYDQGEDGDVVFLAMELVDGRTLRDVINHEGPLSPRAALALLESVLVALAAAHDAGIVHRDVKPENVLISEDGVVKVADFGLARAVTTATSTAQTGVLLGTVAYLSPEQVARGVADARSDVYAAGLLLVELLTGEKAFTGDNPIHVAYQHVHGDVPTPSGRIPGLSPELDALVALATARDPDHRPADAGELLGQLRRSRAAMTAVELDLRPGRTAGPDGPAATQAVPVDLVGAPAAVPGTSGATVGTPSRAASGAAPDIDRTTVMTTGTSPTTALATAGRPPGGQKPAATPRRRRRGARGLLVALVLVLAVGAGTGWVFTVGPLGLTTVPKVAGLTREAAVAVLTPDRLGAEVESAFSETVKAGVVISSEPEVGDQIRRGSPIVLIVSQGPERYAVPTLAGRTVADATDQLAANNLVLGPQTPAWSEEVPAGLVISSEPAAGTPAKKGTKVALTVSKGRQPITLASWVGKSADEAVKAITAQGLSVDSTEQQFDDTVPKGSVISQTPAGGTLYKGDKVSLVVSKGPPLVPVPDVRTMQKGEATRKLHGMGFKVRYESFMGGFFGTVRSQRPGANTSQPKGTTVTLVIV